MANRASKPAGKARKPERINGNSLSPQKELSELLKCRFAEVFVEGKIDGDKLRQSLGEELDTNNERYGLSWAGKAECFRHIQETTTATLKPVRGQSVDFDKTENIFIEGDNLEVLKILQKTYQNKIKMIYIDPPYNTGNDSFIYPDRYKEEKEDYELRAGIKDAEGLLTKDGFWRKNSKDAGHFHSNWLSMMYPRLFLAKNLLREDGVIFVSIDDNEVHNLRMIMDEVFGEENFIGCFTINTTPNARDYGHIGKMHEYCLFYAKQIESTETNLIEDKEKTFKYRDSTGEFNVHPLYNSNEAFSKENRPNLFYPFYLNPKKRVKELGDNFFEIGLIKTSGSIEVWPPLSQKNRVQFVWRWGKEKAKAELNKDIIGYLTEEGEYRIVQKMRTDEKLIRSLINGIEVTTRRGTAEVEGLFGRKIIEFPKSIGLIQLFAKAGLSNDDIVLDFFAGSCTTAHAVMTLNAEDGGNRKFICVQLAEPCGEESEAFKAGFKTIADIGKERIRRAGKKIRKETEGNLKFDKNRLDLGFKVFRLEESNFKQWRENVKTGEELKEQMRMFVDNVKKGAGSEDMLFEIILKNSRFDLNVKVEKKSFDGVDYYRLATENPSTTLRAGSEGTEKIKAVSGNKRIHHEEKEGHEGKTNANEIICLDTKITKKFVDKVLAEKPERFTCLDIAFKNNDQLKTNTALQMESAKIEFKVI